MAYQWKFLANIQGPPGDVSLYGPAWAPQRNVPATADLNTFRIAGVHRITTPDTQTIVNLPAGMIAAGILENLQTGTSTSDWWVQRITQHGNAPRMWWRSTRDLVGTWNDWEEVLTDGGNITELHVFLAVGQSNMSGRGAPSGGSRDPENPRIMQYGATRRVLENATVPLDMHDTASGISPATTFARTYLKSQPPGVGVLIIPAAHGATGFTTSANTYTWTPNAASAPKYDLPQLAIDQATAAVAAAKAAGYTVSVEGILWHQGENNTTMSQATYASNLDSLIGYFRSGLGNSKLPFIVGQMSPEGIDANAGRSNIDAAHQATPDRVAHTGFAAATRGGYNSGDTTHLSRIGVEFIGRNYSNALQAARINADLKPRMKAVEAGVSAVPAQVNSLVPPAVSSYLASDPSVVQAAADMAANNTNLVAKWKPNTAYVAGQQVVSPDGDVVTRAVDGTTGPTYTATNWTPSSNASALATKGLAGGLASLDSGAKVPASQIPDLSVTYVGTTALDAQSAALVGNSASTWWTALLALLKTLFVGKGDQTLSVKDYGAKGDGSTDDTAAINSALAAAAGKTLVFPPATYKITDVLSVPSGVTLNGAGATIDGTGIPAGTVIGQRIAMLAQGSLGAALPVTTAITKWTRVIAGISSTAGLTVGDLILLSNDERPVPGMTRTDRDKGELLIIGSVDSATQITVVTGVLFDYGTTSLQVQKVTPVENLTISGLKIIMGGVGSVHNAIEVRYGRNITVRDNVIDGAEDIAINLRTIFNGKALNNTVRNSTSPAISSTGYGVSIVDGSRDCIAQGNNFYNCRHFVAGGGLWPAAFIDVKNNHGIKSLSAAYDCHEPCFYWTFEGNTGTGVYNGFGIRGQYITVEDNIITDCVGRAYDAGTVDLVTEQRGIRFINNRGIRAGVYGISADGKAAGSEPDCVKIDIEIRGNVLRDCGPDAIMVRNFDGATIIGNNINTPSRHGILALGNASGTPSKRLTIDANTITSPGGDGIQAQFVDDINGTGGVVTSPALYGYEFITCNRTKLAGVTVRTPVRSGIYLNGGAVHTVTGGTVTGGTDAGYDALRGSGAADITVTGGYYAGPRTGVATTTGDRVIITGVNATGAVSATKISSDATSKVLANNLP